LLLETPEKRVFHSVCDVNAFLLFMSAPCAASIYFLAHSIFHKLVSDSLYLHRQCFRYKFVTHFIIISSPRRFHRRRETDKNFSCSRCTIYFSTRLASDIIF
jgi:hypothetical protein